MNTNQLLTLNMSLNINDRVSTQERLNRMEGSRINVSSWSILNEINQKIESELTPQQRLERHPDYKEGRGFKEKSLSMWKEPWKPITAESFSFTK